MGSPVYALGSPPRSTWSEMVGESRLSKAKLEAAPEEGGKCLAASTLGILAGDPVQRSRPCSYSQSVLESRILAPRFLWYRWKAGPESQVTGWNLHSLFDQSWKQHRPGYPPKVGIMQAWLCA